MVIATLYKDLVTVYLKGGGESGGAHKTIFSNVIGEGGDRPRAISTV